MNILIKAITGSQKKKCNLEKAMCLNFQWDHISFTFAEWALARHFAAIFFFIYYLFVLLITHTLRTSRRWTPLHIHNENRTRTNCTLLRFYKGWNDKWELEYCLKNNNLIVSRAV